MNTVILMTNEQLLDKGTAPEIIYELWKQNSGYIYTIIKKYSGLAELDDLFQESYIAVFEAAESYDPEQAAFLTWLDYFLHRHCKKTVCEARGISYPGLDAYIKARKGERLTQRERLRAQKAEAVIKASSANKPVGEDQDGEILDLIPAAVDEIAEADRRIFLEQTRSILWQEVDTLPALQAHIIREHYGSGKTFREIAAGSDIGTSGAQQACSRALNTLEKKRKLRAIADALIYSRAIKKTGVTIFNRTWTSATEDAALKLYEKGMRDHAERTAPKQQKGIRGKQTTV